MNEVYIDSLPEFDGSADHEERMSRLLDSTVRHEHFTSDHDDEFKIIRENGQEQGIFKVWAPHILPSLDGYGDGQESSINWAADLNAKPLSLYESLEEWRAYSEIMDKRLQAIYQERPVAGDTIDVASELFMRLNFAFSQAAPFYNIEALIADHRHQPLDNPIDSNDTLSKGGMLDTVALLLPSAFASFIKTDISNWNPKEFTWDFISKSAEDLCEAFKEEPSSKLGRQYVLLLRIAELAGQSPEDILFAANAIQFIPTEVAGRRDDEEESDAIELLLDILDETSYETTTASIAKDMNALIRFRNWSPAIRSDKNFQGQLWNYGAVCETTDKLLQFIFENKDELLLDFAPIFSEVLAGQIENLDATSAKGRFLLQLLSEQKFNPNLVIELNKKVDQFNQEIFKKLAETAKSQTIIPVTEYAPTLLCGGKVDGLRRASYLFGKESILDGVYISSEAIRDWLYSRPALAQQIDRLSQESDIDKLVSIGQGISQEIAMLDAPATIIAELQPKFANTNIVLRSTSFDEDVAVIGPAPGVYESSLDVDINSSEDLTAALKYVVGSFFSEKAISFRESQRLRHKPHFAVLVQEFLGNAGGSIFMHDDGTIQLNIAAAPHHVNESMDAITVEDFTIDSLSPTPDSNFLDKRSVEQAIDFARRATTVYGPSDLEFAYDSRSKTVKLLQMRTLKHPKNNTVESEIDFENITSISLRSIDDLANINTSDVINLIIDPSINLESFQSQLCRQIRKSPGKVKIVTTHYPIPATCHFANIMQTLGIQLRHLDGNIDDPYPTQ